MGGQYSNLDYLDAVERSRRVMQQVEVMEELRDESAIEESLLYQKIPGKRKIRMKKQEKISDLRDFVKEE